MAGRRKHFDLHRVPRMSFELSRQRFMPLVNLFRDIFVKGVTMLVLTRKEGEEIIVGNGEIRITILDTRRGCVRIGITAPESVPIMRAELLPKLNATAPVETVQNLITPLIAGA